MNFGYVKTCAATPKVRVADVEFNKLGILRAVSEARENGAALLVLPELCLTGYTCGDLFYSDVLLNGARRALAEIAAATKESDLLFFVGLPLKKDGLIYNCAAALNRGKVLAFVPKTYIPNYWEFYEKRYFASFPSAERTWLSGKKLFFRRRGLKISPFPRKSAKISGRLRRRRRSTL